MNKFGGEWTIDKMEIVVSYTKAYLTIMNKQDWVKTLYFDGFAGSGHIRKEAPSSEELLGGSTLIILETDDQISEESLKGTALRILEINDPKPFDIYYFVEKNKSNKLLLEQTIKEQYPLKKTFVVEGDCNKKMRDMVDFLKSNSSYRALAFIDPYGMSVNWESIEYLKNTGIDLWILVPTGIGIGRMLTKSGIIDDKWLGKLESFLGMGKAEIQAHFYRNHTQQDLFDTVDIIEKEKGTIQKAGELYKNRLKTVFKYVSDSFVMKNRNNVIMYHFMMATNNKAGLKIANDIIKPKYKL
jgi:three-Cys-motif partner protein